MPVHVFITETTSKEQPVVEQPTPGESDQPQTSSIPPPMTDDPLPTETPTTNTTTTFAAGFDLSSVATPLDNEAPEPPAIEEGAETPLASPKEPMEEDKGEEGGAEAELEEAAEEEIMECDMEIEDESPVASGDEATPLDEGAKSILLATQIPVPPSVTSSNVIGGGQKVEQVLPPPISQESAMTKSLDEEDEPLPPGVEVEEKDQAEPLPPGIENGDNTPGPPISSTGSDTVETQSHGGGEAMGGGENGDVASKDSGEVATSTAVAVTTTTNTGSVADSQTATPPTQGAVSAAYSAYSSAVAASQAPPTSYTTASAAGYYQQPGAAQYSYAYGQQQGYGDYAAYSAYMQQAAYAGYTPQYYQGESIFVIIGDVIFYEHCHPTSTSLSLLSLSLSLCSCLWCLRNFLSWLLCYHTLSATTGATRLYLVFFYSVIGMFYVCDRHLSLPLSLLPPSLSHNSPCSLPLSLKHTLFLPPPVDVTANQYHPHLYGKQRQAPSQDHDGTVERFQRSRYKEIVNKCMHQFRNIMYYNTFGMVYCSKV